MKDKSIITLRCKTRDKSDYILDVQTFDNEREYGIRFARIKEQQEYYYNQKINNSNGMFYGVTDNSNGNKDLVEYGEIVKLYIVEK